MEKYKKKYDKFGDEIKPYTTIIVQGKFTTTYIRNGKLYFQPYGFEELVEDYNILDIIIPSKYELEKKFGEYYSQQNISSGGNKG